MFKKYAISVPTPTRREFQLKTEIEQVFTERFDEKNHLFFAPFRATRRNAKKSAVPSACTHDEKRNRI
jgi:hypothetical protein